MTRRHELAHMTPAELRRGMEEAFLDENAFHHLIHLMARVARHSPDPKGLAWSKRLLGVFGHAMAFGRVVHADVDLFHHANARYLPIAKEYRAYRARVISGEITHPSEDPVFLRLRGRLGAASRELYRLQEATFSSLLDLLVPYPVNDIISPAIRRDLFSVWKRLEKRWLSSARGRI